jgi:hypothetical protein
VSHSRIGQLDVVVAEEYRQFVAALDEPPQCRKDLRAARDHRHQELLGDLGIVTQRRPNEIVRTARRIGLGQKIDEVAVDAKLDRVPRSALVGQSVDHFGQSGGLGADLKAALARRLRSCSAQMEIGHYVGSPSLFCHRRFLVESR